jgi:hypothetical protein
MRQAHSQRWLSAGITHSPTRGSSAPPPKSYTFNRLRTGGCRRKKKHAKLQIPENEFEIRLQKEVMFR